MTSPGFSLFDTAIGTCGLVWTKSGIIGTQLPERTPALTRARLRERFPTASEQTAPPGVRRSIKAIVRLLEGKSSDLSDIELDMSAVPPFHRKVYDAARRIPAGTTLSYGEIAALLGSPGAARAVGQAMRRNPFAIVVPCHRVLAAGGKIGGFTANGGLDTKRRLLAIERDERPAPRERVASPADLPFDSDAALQHLRAEDAVLSRLVERVGPFGLRLKPMPQLFSALAEAITYQQLTGKAAATIYGRFCALFPGSEDGPKPIDVLNATDEKLRSAGLSRSKILALRDLADKSQSGQLPSIDELRSLPDDEVIRRLTPVRGIGRWTVEMLLIFRLGRPDVLPLDDYGIRKGFALTFKKRELPDAKTIQQRAKRWRPYCTVASWYLWRAVDLHRSERKAPE